MSYMIVLQPPKAIEDRYIQASQKLFAASRSQYFLKNQSLPHITLCQFACKEPEKALELWEKVKQSQVKVFSIRFLGVSLVEGKKAFKGSYWVELSVARDTALLNLYQEIVTTPSRKREGF